MSYYNKKESVKITAEFKMSHSNVNDSIMVIALYLTRGKKEYFAKSSYNTLKKISKYFVTFLFILQNIPNLVFCFLKKRG